MIFRLLLWRNQFAVNIGHFRRIERHGIHRMDTAYEWHPRPWGRGSLIRDNHGWYGTRGAFWHSRWRPWLEMPIVLCGEIMMERVVQLGECHSLCFDHAD